MANASRLRPSHRPVFIADFGPSERATAEAEVIRLPRQEVADNAGPGMPLTPGIRTNFPAAGEKVEGGLSDGYCYRVTFAAGRLERTYDMVRDFLRQQGYGGLPLPEDVEELRRFCLPPKLRHQLSFFGDNGYVHNPVKILFPIPAGQRGALVLELYNEASTDHLLRFHQRK
jgi:hypothetical protein